MSDLQSFNYMALNDEARDVIQQHTFEIKNLMSQTARDIIEIGNKLVHVKQQLGHGHFGDWLNAEFDWKERTARNFMRVAEAFESANFADLSIAPSALYLLAAPSTPEQARHKALEIASQGQNITYSKAKKIINQNKEKTGFKSSLHKSTSTANGLEVTSSELASSIPPARAFLESQPEPQTIDVSAEFFEEEKLFNKEVSAKDPYELEFSSNIDKLCKALINEVEYLKEDQVAELVRAIAQHWTINKFFELSNKGNCQTNGGNNQQ